MVVVIYLAQCTEKVFPNDICLVFAAVECAYRRAYLHNLALDVGLYINVDKGVDCVLKLTCAFEDGLFVVFLFGDVAHHANYARYLSFVVFVGQFGGGNPFLVAVLVGNLLFDVERRIGGIDDVLFKLLDTCAVCNTKLSVGLVNDLLHGIKPNRLGIPKICNLVFQVFVLEIDI
jgi:hypothetical protein